MTILLAENVSKTYGTGENSIKALDHISLEIKKSTFVSIVGSSGSGKTTLLNVLSGLDYFDEGLICIEDIDISKFKEDELIIFRRDRIGFVFQDYNLIPVLNVYENITLPLQFGQKKIDENFVKDVMQSLGILDKIYQMPNQLSGGQKQRVAIGRALISKPAIILADEPTGNLDTHNSDEIIKLLQKGCQNYGQTIIIITHNLSIADKTDQVFQMENGKIVRV